MKKNLQIERRKHRRLRLTKLIAYKKFDIEGVTETIDISKGGMRIKTEFAIQEDERLDLSLRIGGGDFISTARVIYCHPQDDQIYEVGLEFETTSAGHLTLLDIYLSDPQ
jgi:hypothetical protein